MKLLVLGHREVTELLPMADCIGLMREALGALARGEVFQPLRSGMRPEGASGVMGLMPSYRGSPTPLFGLKEICVFPGNPARGLDAHQGLVILHDGEDGRPLAIMDASAITAIRTAAVSAVATDALARDDARIHAIVGAGVQARAHLDALAMVRAPAEVRIAARTLDHARALADEARSRDVPARACASVEDAVRGADVVTTVTSSREPVVRGAWLAAGAHVNAVGSSVASARELDADAVARASLFVDRRESTVNESGDYLDALREGAIRDGHIRAELGEVLTGAKPGRVAREEITLFKSLGLGIEDLWCAARLLDVAKSTDRGSWVDVS